MNVTKDIFYVGVNDYDIDLFEGQYEVPNGMCYNSYVIVDEKCAVIDTVDERFSHEWLDNVQNALAGRKPDYLVIHHMEPDHSGNIDNFMKAFPETTIVSSQMAFGMMKNFFGTDYEDRRIVVKEGSTLELGNHTLTFVAAPMVHWPEVIVSYDSADKVLFSADGFGKFGAMDADEDWACEARRYFIGIVGKFGPQVQALLKKAATLDIAVICPTHGPILTENLGYYLNLYDIWSSYRPEDEGIVIAYTSVYGHTRKAVELLEQKLIAKGCPSVSVFDLARDDMAEAIEDAFRYSKLVLATTTYNTSIYPFMNDFITRLEEHNFQNRTVALIENGSWAPTAAKIMKEKLSACKDITFAENTVRITSALSDVSRKALEDLAEELCKDYEKSANPNDMSALFKIGYGLYVVTSNDGKKDNGLIVNSVTQLTDAPNRVAVAINRRNYSSHIVANSGILNVNCLSEEAPFAIFQRFGFQSGRTNDKFEGFPDVARSENGLLYLTKYTNSFMSLKVEQMMEFESHLLFICEITEAKVFNNVQTMTYNYYQANVKPAPPKKEETKKGWVCKVCGYVYEGEELPEDFICPVCKHPASDFEPLK